MQFLWRKLSLRLRLFLSFGVLFSVMTVLSLLVQSALYKQSRVQSLINHEMPAKLAHLGAEVALELAPSLYLSRSLANNDFVEDWIQRGMPKAELPTIQEIMSEIFRQEKLASVFFVANDGTRIIYYHFSGRINYSEVLEGGAEHIWYFDYLYSLKPYELNLDSNYFTDEELQIFANYISTAINQFGEPLIVAGIGLDVEKLADLISSYKLGAQGEASLANKDGLVEVSSGRSIITNLAATPELQYLLGHEGEDIKEVNTTSGCQIDYARDKYGNILTRCVHDPTYEFTFNADKPIDTEE